MGGWGGLPIRGLSMPNLPMHKFYMGMQVPGSI
jgi:hypothetical protein